ncbi:hypothetical protein ACFQZ4_36620 [Catellatospora coxensis]
MSSQDVPGRPSVIGRGVAPVVCYAFMTAVVNVYAGRVFQSLDPAAVAAISFSLTGVLFAALELGTRGSGIVAMVRARWRDVVAINVTTAMAWLTVLFSLKYIEPAIVNVLSLAVGPVFVALAGPILRRSSKTVAAEMGASAGIFVLILALTWGSLTGRSAVGQIGHREAVLGVGLAVVSGLASAANIVLSKRLSDSAFSPKSVLAVRFFITIAASWLMVGAAAQPRLAQSLLPGLVLTAISVVVPLYLLQLGVKHAEPMTVSLLVCLGPGFALAFQLFDRRLTVSPLSVGCIMGITALVAWGVVTRHRAQRHAQPGRVAIVDAYSTGRHLPAALRAYGAECVHVQSSSPDLHLVPAEEGFVRQLSHDDVDATVGELRRLQVGLVVAGAESGVELADQLSAALGTPGNGMSRPGHAATSTRWSRRCGMLGCRMRRPSSPETSTRSSAGSSGWPGGRS